MLIQTYLIVERAQIGLLFYDQRVVGAAAGGPPTLPFLHSSQGPQGKLLFHASSILHACSPFFRIVYRPAGFPCSMQEKEAAIQLFLPAFMNAFADSSPDKIVEKYDFLQVNTSNRLLEPRCALTQWQDRVTVDYVSFNVTMPWQVWRMRNTCLPCGASCGARDTKAGQHRVS